MDFLYAFFLKRFLTVWKILVFDLLNMLRGLTIVYTAFNIKFLKSFGQITYVYILMAFQCDKTTILKTIDLI